MKEPTMRIDGTEFGNITIDGKRYGHDVVIRLTGEVVNTAPHISYRRTRQKFVFEKGAELLVVGSGQEGNVRLSPEAGAYLAKKGCEIAIQPTAKALRIFNETRRKKVGLFHVTC
jgi:hypothetical protein